MNPTALLFSTVFSCLGVAYFTYGKKQLRFSALLAGAALLIYPYFVSNLYLMVAIGLGLMATPFMVDF